MTFSIKELNKTKQIIIIQIPSTIRAKLTRLYVGKDWMNQVNIMKECQVSGEIQSQMWQDYRWRIFDLWDHRGVRNTRQRRGEKQSFLLRKKFPLSERGGWLSCLQMSVTFLLAHQVKVEATQKEVLRGSHEQKQK